MKLSLGLLQYKYASISLNCSGSLVFKVQALRRQRKLPFAAGEDLIFSSIFNFGNRGRSSCNRLALKNLLWSKALEKDLLTRQEQRRFYFLFCKNKKSVHPIKEAFFSFFWFYFPHRKHYVQALEHCYCSFSTSFENWREKRSTIRSCTRRRWPSAFGHSPRCAEIQSKTLRPLWISVTLCEILVQALSFRASILATIACSYPIVELFSLNEIYFLKLLDWILVRFSRVSFLAASSRRFLITFKSSWPSQVSALSVQLAHHLTANSVDLENVVEVTLWTQINLGTVTTPYRRR